MASARRHVTLLRHLQPRRFSSAADETPLQRSVRSAVESRDFLRIPRLFPSYSPNPSPSPNPFSFLSLLPPTLAARLVGDLLRSFLPLRPRSIPVPALSSLLLSLLIPPNPKPNPYLSLSLSLAVLQPLLRSGLPPPPHARVALSRFWLRVRYRPQPHAVAGLLSSIPAALCLRPPDLSTLSYLLSSLPPAEAVAVLRELPAAGIEPDRESYCTVIEALPAPEAEGLLREMVAGKGMAPRRGTAARVVAKMGRDGEARRAAALVRWLEREGVAVGFEAYEAAAEACVRSGEAVAAGRVVAEMASRGFVPYAGVRRRVVEGLAGIGQGELASAVRLRLAGIGS